MLMTTLDNIKPGQGGLLDMGLTPRTNIYVNKVAPMGDPMELNLRGYVLTLRLEDAAKIEVDTEAVK